MINNSLKKKLAILNIFLFVGVVFTASVNGDLEKISIKSETYINGDISLYVDPPEILWDKTFGGINMDYGVDIKQTKDNGYIITGSTYSFGSDLSDAWLIKTDSYGNEEWNKTYDKKYEIDTDEMAFSVQQTNDDGYIIAGDVSPYWEGYFDLFLVKTDNTGDEQWQKVYGGSDVERANEIIKCIDDGYIIAGMECSSGDSCDAWLFKIDDDGEELWNKTYGGDNLESFRSLKQTTDGGYILTGVTYSYGRGWGNIWLVKTDSNGNELWNKTFGTGAAHDGKYVQQTTDGGYIILGDTGSLASVDNNAWLIKTDSYGNEEWNKTYDRNNGYDHCDSVQETNDGGYILIGDTCSLEENTCDIWLFKTNEYGDKIWEMTLGRDNIEWGQSVQQTSDGGYILIGTIRSNDTYGLDRDTWLIKIASEDTPKKPTLNGPVNGKSGENQEYTISTIDPNGDDVLYYIDWGDGTNSGWIGPYNSGEICNINHNWREKNTYIIKAKAKDTNGLESGWSTLEVSMSKTRSKAVNLSILKSLERGNMDIIQVISLILDFISAFQ